LDIDFFFILKIILYWHAFFISACMMLKCYQHLSFSNCHKNAKYLNTTCTYMYVLLGWQSVMSNRPLFNSIKLLFYAACKHISPLFELYTFYFRSLILSGFYPLHYIHSSLYRSVNFYTHIYDACSLLLWLQKNF